MTNRKKWRIGWIISFSLMILGISLGMITSMTGTTSKHIFWESLPGLCIYLVGLVGAIVFSMLARKY